MIQLSETKALLQIYGFDAISRYNYILKHNNYLCTVFIHIDFIHVYTNTSDDPKTFHDNKSFEDYITIELKYIIRQNKIKKLLNG